jgi:hypothetical protein
LKFKVSFARLIFAVFAICTEITLCNFKDIFMQHFLFAQPSSQELLGQ